MRLPFSLVALGLMLALTFAACGSDGDQQSPSPDGDATSTGSVTPASGPLPSDPEELMTEALRSTFREDAGVLFQESDPSVVRKMGETGDQRLIPVLIDILRFPWLLTSVTEDAAYASLAALTGETYDDLEPRQLDWGWWAEWLGTHPEIEPLPGYERWKGDLFGQLVDPAMSNFLGRDDFKPNIRVEEIVWGGVRKDGIPDLRDPPSVTASEADYLEPDDRVFGVSFNGESRAYPLRIMNAHEMANDEVGGVHFALAY